MAINKFKKMGFYVETYTTSLSEDELLERIPDFHAIGIRSKTQLTKKVLEKAVNLIVIGCFCIGTNQVDVDYAMERGIPVFNSPFCNSRSVAELVLCEIILLSRQLGDRNMEMHNKEWNKVSAKCHEVRNKTLGIIGYGHIGSQLSVLAEGVGLNVIYYDTQIIMPHGNASSCKLDFLLENSDFVSVHVPETEETINLMSRERIEMIKKGGILINASRGSVVDVDAVKDAILRNDLNGAAFDVFPSEPKTNGAHTTGLEHVPNVFLTPHIGGCTEEAQEQIGAEVCMHITNFLVGGSTRRSVNMPELFIKPPIVGCRRILNFHQNTPGFLKSINQILSNYNIERQVSESKRHVSYFVTDVRDVADDDLKTITEAIRKIPQTISTRIIE